MCEERQGVFDQGSYGGGDEGGVGGIRVVFVCCECGVELFGFVCGVLLF